MKKNKKIEKMTVQEWADAAAWLSGEETAGKDPARVLLDDNADLLRDWNKMKMADPQGNIDVDKAWSKLNRRIEEEGVKQPARVVTIIPSLLRIAAMVIIVLGLGWALFSVVTPEKITVASAIGEKNIEVVLPDGSKVSLNRDSHLTYPKSFNNNNRKVSLKGEAFFDITPDPSRPFTIDAGNARVKVLGTSFNVITDNGNNEVEVYVSTGKVLLTNNDGTRSLTLEPGFIGKISADRGVQNLNTNTNYMSWNTDKLIYDGERLEVVFNDLKRSYNIDIEAGDPEIENYRLHTTFENEPHDTIIKLICTSFNLQAAKEGETYSLTRRQKNGE